MVIITMATMIAMAGRTTEKKYTTAKCMAGIPVNTTKGIQLSTTTCTPVADIPEADTQLADTPVATSTTDNL